MKRMTKPSWRMAATGLAIAAVALMGTVPVSASATPITITFWDHVQSSKNIGLAYENAAKQFEQAHPGVNVVINLVPFSEYENKVTVAMEGGQGPDIMSMDEVWTPQFAAAGFIKPLSSYLNGSGIKPSMFFSGAWQTVVYKGQPYALPLGFDVWEQLYYNPGLFAKAGISGPPTRWAQMLTDAQKLTGNGNFGIGLMGAKSEVLSVWLDSLLYSNGGQVLNAAGQPAIDSPQNAATLAFVQQLEKYAPSGVVSATETTDETLFAQGKLGMLLDGNWAQDTMNATATFGWKIAVPPAPPGKIFHGALGGWNLGINSHSAHPQLAYDFVKLLTTTPSIQVAEAANVPALRSASAMYFKTRRQPNVILQTLNTGLPRPITPVYPSISNIEQNMAQSVLEGHSIAAALASAQSQFKAAIAQNG
jgi:multiple sugar transport system substrate-binding protein